MTQILCVCISELVFVFVFVFMCTVFVSVFGCRLTGRVHYSAVTAGSYCTPSTDTTSVHHLSSLLPSSSLFVCLNCLFACLLAFCSWLNFKVNPSLCGNGIWFSCDWARAGCAGKFTDMLKWFGEKYTHLLWTNRVDYVWERELHEEKYLSKHALMECDSAVTGLGQDVREGKGSVSCNYRGSLSGGLASW